MTGYHGGGGNTPSATPEVREKERERKRISRVVGVLSSATCFVTYRRLPAYKKPNGGGSNLPPPSRLQHSPSLFPSSRPLSRPPSPSLLSSVACETPGRRAQCTPRDRITSLSVLTAKTRNWGTM